MSVPKTSAARAHSSPQPRADAPTSWPVEHQQYHDWFLLWTVSRARGHRLTLGELRRKLKVRRVIELLGLDAARALQILDALTQVQLIERRETRGTTSYRLTDRGQEHLYNLIPHPGFQDDAIGHVHPDRRREQHAVLLLHLLESSDQRLSKTDANRKLTDRIRQKLGLDPRVADIRRGELFQRSFIEIIMDHRTEFYRLTPDGRDYLGTIENFPDVDFRLTGHALNQLLATVRAAAHSFRNGPQPAEQLPEDIIMAENQGSPVSRAVGD